MRVPSLRRLRPPRQTVRLKLTLVYGALFLISGAGLLAITYVLVSNATDKGYTFVDPAGRSTTIIGDHGAPGPGDIIENTKGLTEDQRIQQNKALETQSVQQREEQLQNLLTQSGIALGIMAIVSILLGWLIAGRILRRLSTISATAREISATNLHERLALPGPSDELQELGNTIDDLLGRLESAFSAQRQFIANASHELRTPLARQRVVVQVALSDPDASAESLRLAHERVLASGEQQERLIAALLVLAQGQAGPDVRRPFDLARLVRQVVDSRLAEAESRHITLHTRLWASPTAGKVDLVERLVVNLIDNALRYNMTAGRVDVVAETRGQNAVLTVLNTGPKVAEADMDRLFQPFQRLGGPERTRTEGLGLGLSIVHAVATSHGAVIDAAPRPGGGLAITVTFPGPHSSSQSDSARPTSAIDRGLTMSR